MKITANTSCIFSIHHQPGAAGFNGFFTQAEEFKAVKKVENFYH
jgi:hypothetical protein